MSRGIINININPVTHRTHVLTGKTSLPLMCSIRHSARCFSSHQNDVGISKSIISLSQILFFLAENK